MDFLLYESNKNEDENIKINQCDHILVDNQCTICGEYIVKLDQAYDQLSVITQNTVFNNVVENSFNTSFINSTYFNNLNKWTIWDQNYKEKCLLTTIYYVKDRCLGKIPNIVIDSAIIILKKINLVKHEKGPLKDKYVIKRGTNKLALIAVCLFDSSLDTSHPLTYEEISKLFNLDIAFLYKGDKIYKQLQKSFNKDKYFDISKISYNFIFRFCNQFEYEKNIFDFAIEINDNLSKIEQEIITNIPGIRAISCIYIAMLHLHIDKDKNIRRKLQNQYLHIFNPTLLLKSFKNIKKMKNILISNELIELWQNICDCIRLEKKKCNK